jgi:hypothetical protein
MLRFKFVLKKQKWPTRDRTFEKEVFHPPCPIVKILRIGTTTIFADLRTNKKMQLHTGADHFGNVIKRGIIKRSCR